VQDIAQEAVKKRRRATKKPYSRSIVGATLEVIQKKRTEKPEVRDAAREAALRCVSCLSCLLFESSVFRDFLYSNLFIYFLHQSCNLIQVLEFYFYRAFAFYLTNMDMSSYLIIQVYPAGKLKRGLRKQRMRRRPRKQK
jgi:hypothetical protein